MNSTVDSLAISDKTVFLYICVVFGVVAQIINIFGIITNIINIICFAKQGFEDSVNISLLGLAVADLGSLVTMSWTCICVVASVSQADLPFDPMDVTYLTGSMAHFAFTRVSSWITAFITMERCLCITAPLKIKRFITPKRATMITVCVFIVFIFSGSPVYAVNRLANKFSALRNKTIYGLVSTQDRESVEMISFAINNFFIPLCAFIVIVVCTTILSFKLHKQSKWRMTTTGGANVDRVSTRNQKAAKMVVMISTLFIVCFVPAAIIMLGIAFLPALSVDGKYINLTIVMSGPSILMECINSSMNIVIYYHMSSKYRNNFNKLF